MEGRRGVVFGGEVLAKNFEDEEGRTSKREDEWHII
jgi:hypothetical protein